MCSCYMLLRLPQVVGLWAVTDACQRDRGCIGGQPFENKQGALDLRDAYFETTIKPQQLWAGRFRSRAVAGAVVAIRRSLRPFSLNEKDVEVRDRIALGT
jgi:hypothetical protein